MAAGTLLLYLYSALLTSALFRYKEVPSCEDQAGNYEHSAAVHEFFLLRLGFGRPKKAMLEVKGSLRAWRKWFRSWPVGNCSLYPCRYLVSD